MTPAPLDRMQRQMATTTFMEALDGCEKPAADRNLQKATGRGNRQSVTTVDRQSLAFVLPDAGQGGNLR